MKKTLLILTLGVSHVAFNAPAMDQNVATAQPQIILNGITTIFGDKRALFKMEDRDYILAEGERAGTVELLSVDVKTGAIKIKVRGVIQVLDICKTPALALDASQLAASAQNISPANDNNSKTISTGTEPLQASKSQTTADSILLLQNQIGSADPKTAPANDNGANPNAPKPDPWWVVGSKSVEQARLESAESVANGLADPQPLTPLTPPGTPANLIGPDKLFFDHM